MCAENLGGCGRVYQTHDGNQLAFAPYDCECGARLMPRRVDGTGNRTDWIARAICRECFDDLKGPQVLS